MAPHHLTSTRASCPSSGAVCVPFTVVTRLSRKEDRRRFISDLQSAIVPTGPTRDLEVAERTDSTCLNAIGTGLSAQVWFLHSRRQGVPLVSWYDAAAPLAGFVAGAWRDVNQFHRRKATSFPTSLNELIGCLVAGLDAGRVGSAFLTACSSAEGENA